MFSIWICSQPAADKRNTITRFSLTEENVVGEAEYKLKEYDLLEIVMVCLGGKEGDENYTGLIRLLDKLTSPDCKSEELRELLQNEYNIKLTTEINREVLDMCNISYGIYEWGVLDGEARGEARGETRGRENTLVENIRGLMKNLGLSFDEALKALGLPEKDYSKYKKLVLG